MLHRNRNEFQGKDRQQVMEKWLHAQIKMIEIFTKSKVPTVVRNTDEREWSHYAAQILKVTRENPDK